MPKKNTNIINPKKKKWNNSDAFYLNIMIDDRDNFVRMVKRMRPRLMTLAASEEFIEAYGVGGKKASEYLLGYFALLEQTYSNVRTYTPLQNDVNVLRNDRLVGFRQSEKIADRLKKMDRNGNYPVANALKTAAVQIYGSAEPLFEDLYYMNEKLNMGLNLAEIYPESVMKKKKMSGPPSWEAYRDDHLRNIPYDIKGRQECLARAMVGAYKVHQAEHTGIHDSFSVKKAREYAEKLMKNEMFKRLSADRVAVDQLCHDAARNPQNLHKVTAQLLWPFCIAETTPGNKRDEALKERSEILTRLQKMTMLMDGTRGRSSQWKALQKSIRNIGPDEFQSGGEETLNQIFFAANEYIKDKLDGGKGAEQQKRVSQTLDVLAELAKCSPFARMKVQDIFDKVKPAIVERANEEISKIQKRVNELEKEINDGLDITKGKRISSQKAVELMKSIDAEKKQINTIKKNANSIAIRHYGAENLHRHTNNTQEFIIRDYLKELKLSGPEQERVSRTVYENYPDNDPSQLPLVPQNTVTRELKPLLKTIRSFIDSDQGEGTRMSKNEVRMNIATALALADAEMYYQPKGETGKSQVVIDMQDFNHKNNDYLNDEAVSELAGKYTAPGSRKKLAAKNRVGFDIGKLQKEYNDVVKKMNRPGKVL